MFFSFYAKSYIKSKDIILKKEARDFLSNIRLICFINNETLDIFYKKLKRKYESNFPNFFNYFGNTYLNKGLFSDHSWNYYTYFMKNSNIENFFFINNICGSNNRTLNNKIIGMCKFYYSFIRAINVLINYFNTKIYIMKDM